MDEVAEAAGNSISIVIFYGLSLFLVLLFLSAYNKKEILTGLRINLVLLAIILLAGLGLGMFWMGGMLFISSIVFIH